MTRTITLSVTTTGAATTMTCQRCGAAQHRGACDRLVAARWKRARRNRRRLYEATTAAINRFDRTGRPADAAEARRLTAAYLRAAPVAYAWTGASS